MSNPTAVSRVRERIVRKNFDPTATTDQIIVDQSAQRVEPHDSTPVSYTHLTLPTILLV